MEEISVVGGLKAVVGNRGIEKLKFLDGAHSYRRGGSKLECVSVAREWVAKDLK